MRSGLVSLVGRPNAGKSTLLNRLVGEKLAIVSDKPQTTRTRVLGARSYRGGQIVYLDTPGIHRPLYRLNVRMVDAALETFDQVDVVALVVDASAAGGAGDRYVLELLRRVTRPRVLVLNKIDRLEKERLLPLMEHYDRAAGFTAIVPVSALTGENVEQLERVLLQQLPEGEPLYPDDFLTDQPERVFVAEIIREQVLHHTRDELPFSTAVQVDRFEEIEERARLDLYCSIVVERESQKAIVIGRAGAMIKTIGTAARLALEQFFDTSVYLDLHVKVRPDWREDERVLDTLGIPRVSRKGKKTRAELKHTKPSGR